MALKLHEVRLVRLPFKFNGKGLLEAVPKCVYEIELAMSSIAGEAQKCCARRTPRLEKNPGVD